MSIRMVSLGLLLLCSFGEARAREGGSGTTTVRVLVPSRVNLQFMSFWLAKGAGFFQEEGIEVELSVPARSKATKNLFRHHDAEVAVLPRPYCLELVGEEFPLVVVANLLENDPINLIVRCSIAEERQLTDRLPVAKRLKKMRGLRIGVAPHPPTRLRELFELHDLDVDREVELVIVRGRGQNAFFGEGKVDALYCHTPYLETALADQDAVLVVNQSAGEVPELGHRQIHMLVTTRRFAEQHPKLAEGFVRAIYRAQFLMHGNEAGALAALRKEFPEKNRRHLETIVSLYRYALPETPVVSAQRLLRELELFPAGRRVPDLSGIAIGRFVAPEFADQVVRGASASGEARPRKN